MGEGLEWILEIDAKADGLTSLLKMLEGVDKAQVKVTTSSEKASEGHKKHGEKAKELEGVLDRLVHNGLEPFEKRLKSIAEFEFIRKGVDALIDAPMEIAEKLKELGEEAVTTAAKMERTEKSFGFLFGHEGGTEVLEYIEKIGGATEFTRDRLRGAALDLAKVGFSGEGLKRAIGASIDMAALNPDKASGLSDSLFALEQAKRTGMVNNRTLRATGIGEDTFFKALSDRTGEDVKSLKKKMAAGKVDADDALETLYASIAKKTGKDFLGGAGVEMGNTLEAKLTHLGELPERFFEKLRHTDAFDKLSDAADRLLQKLDPESATGKKLFEALESGASAVVDALDSIDIDEVGGAITELASDIRPAIEAFKDLSEFVITTARGLEEAVGIASQVASFGTGSAIFKWAKNREDYIKATGGGYGHEGSGVDNRSFKDKFVGFFKSFSEGAAAAGTMSGEGMKEGIMSSIDDVANASSMMAGSATEALQSKLGIQSPSKVFRDRGKMTGEGFALGVEDSGDRVDSAIGSAFGAPPQLAARGAGGSSAPISISFGDINIESAHGASPGEHAQAVRIAVQAELMDVAERMRAKMGA